MMAAGELDALFSLYIPESFLRGAPHIRRLFADHKRSSRTITGAPVFFRSCTRS